jgi:putative ABC transport system permease protein
VSDLVAAARRLRRSPLATFAMSATLALGVAAVTTTFTVVDDVVLRPLPFPGSERAVVLCETAPRLSGFCVASPPNVEDWGREIRSIERFGVARDWPVRVAAGGAPLALRGGIATPGYFDVAGARAALGRLLVPHDLQPGGPVAVVLANGAWHRQFGGDPGVVGRAVTVDGRDAVVVGILAADAYTPLVEADAWIPLTAIDDDVTNRGWRGFTAIGRLRRGVGVAVARREMEVVRARLAAAYPDTNREYGIEVQGLRERTALPVRSTLVAFLAGVSCVLLIGCANVAGLMLVRAAGRQRELAMRAALGAGRARLVREMLAESLLLAGLGAALALLLSWAAVRAFVVLAPTRLPRVAEVTFDARALAFGTLVALATTLVFGLVPALRATRADLTSVLSGGRTTDGGGARLRRGLVVAQAALALALLASAGALARSVAAALRWNPGFDPHGVAVVPVFVAPEAHRSGLQAVISLERASAAVAELPDVGEVGLASAGPLFGGVETTDVGVFGRPADEAVAARWYDVSPGYFGALGRAVVRGRDFERQDGPGSPGVAIVNETLARRLWPGRDAIGGEVTADGERRVVVGVVRDVPPLPPATVATPEAFWPKRQYPRFATFLVVRAASGDAGPLEAPIRARLAALDPALDPGRFRTLDLAMDRVMVRPRFALALASTFAATALGLAAVGLYGVLAFSVASRTRELGVRLALGASPARLARATVSDGLRLVGLGFAIGVPASVAAERLLSSLVPELPRGGLPSLAAAAIVFAGVSLVAAGLPARRASRLDPAVALRLE